ncbi:antitoxin VapB family protein [Candidatus Micrarchaeota archaeon]|nr:antitoxin VapB family protein [Candidatus Micrarchaeota archaeon]
MAFKTITLSVEAYELLKASKKTGESFSDEVIRTFRHQKFQKLSDLAGILTDEEADELDRNVEQIRKSAQVRPWSF